MSTNRLLMKSGFVGFTVILVEDIRLRGCQISPIYGCSVSLPKPQGFQGAWKKLQNTLPRLLSQHLKCVTPIQNFKVALKLFLLP